MVVLVQTEARDGVGDDALGGEGVVVGTAEELFFGVWIVDEVSAVSGEFGAKVGAIEAGEPEGAGGDSRVRAADHLEFEVGDNCGEWKGRMGEEGAISKAAYLLRSEEREDYSPARAWAGGEDVGEGEDGGSTGCVVVGSVVDQVGAWLVRVGLSNPEVIEVCGEEDGFGLRCGATEDGDSVPGLNPGRVFEPGHLLSQASGNGCGKRAALDKGVVIAAGLEPEGLQLRGGE